MNGRAIIDLLIVLVLLTLAYLGIVAMQRGRSDTPAKSEYLGILPHGVEAYRVCLDGVWLMYSINPKTGFHILAPHIKDSGIGVDLPECKGS